MRNLRTSVLASMTLGLCLLSYLLAGNAATKGTTHFEEKLASAHKSLADGSTADASDGAGMLVGLSERAVGNSAHTRTIVSEAVEDSYSNDNSKSSLQLQILQAMQNQKLIEQNQRIIQLLEQQSERKTN